MLRATLIFLGLCQSWGLLARLPLPARGRSHKTCQSSPDSPDSDSVSPFWTSEKAQSVVTSELGLKRRLVEIERQGVQYDEEIARKRDSTRKASRSVSLLSSSSSSSSSSDTAFPPPIPTFPTANSTPTSPASSAVSQTSPRPAFLDFDLDYRNLWVEKGGNFVYTPENLEAPLGVIHFLGGAFVGAAPHLTYRYLLESLGDAGYIVVATPYRLDLDYVRSCDEILAKFDAVAVDLAVQYGAIPVIGLGHSCGALLQTLITSLFPDAPRLANILISFNNKPAAAAIPGFEEVVVPLSEYIMGDNTQSTSLRETIRQVRSNMDNILFKASSSQFVPSFVEKSLVPLLKQSLEIVDQVPPLLKIISNGEREFSPTPIDTKEVCRRMYRARHTLLIRFENDSIDESGDIEKVLREANTIMRMKRPMVEMEVQLRDIKGTHITPLTQNIFLEPPSIFPIPDILSPVRSQLREGFLMTIDEVKSTVILFLQQILSRNP